MTKAQRRQYKADNRSRRAAEVVLAGKPNPRSKTSLRRRFDELHAAWRAAVGIEEFTGPVPVLAVSTKVSRTPDEGVIVTEDEARESITPARRKVFGTLAAGSVSSA